MNKRGKEDYHLFDVDKDGSNQKELTPNEGVKVNILASLKEAKDQIVISINKRIHRFLIQNDQYYKRYSIIK